TLKKRRDLAYEYFDNTEGLSCVKSSGAFYVFPDVSHFFGKSFSGTVLQGANDLTMYLLNEANVALVTGEAFGDKDCIRISYAASEETLTEAMRRIKIALEKLS
ncbi:aspartate aminotransferase, partial [Candidatus Aerophobetes bacterium]